MATDSIAINVTDNTEHTSLSVTSSDSSALEVSYPSSEVRATVADDTEQRNLTVAPSDPSTSYSSEENDPYYVGAEIEVERVSNGVKVTATDRHGTTSATVYDGSADKNFVYIQATPSAEWWVTHDLNKYPSITVVDSAGNVVEGNVQHLDENNAVLTFSGAFAGKAFFN